MAACVTRELFYLPTSWIGKGTQRGGDVLIRGERVWLPLPLPLPIRIGEEVGHSRVVRVWGPDMLFYIRAILQLPIMTDPFNFMRTDSEIGSWTYA